MESMKRGTKMAQAAALIFALASVAAHADPVFYKATLTKTGGDGPQKIVVKYVYDDNKVNGLVLNRPVDGISIPDVSKDEIGFVFVAEEELAIFTNDDNTAEVYVVDGAGQYDISVVQFKKAKLVK